MEKEIQESLRKAEVHVAKLRKTNNRFIYISLIASVLATILAASAAFWGPALSKALLGLGPEDKLTPAWKWTCGVVAIFTATATVFTTLHKQFSIPERLAKATECIGKLKSIQFDLLNTTSNKDELVKDYKKILETYGEYIL